ncbi:uncharacterized protein LOC119072918 [Bradysia coprophila]|uniref:uncharacterized protein LOC119072918 n=1 Tax=Bradysia coprophila TaxID=38358 RepID=UPI00187D7451|nr:uncharacterized protein LOC119072918 [Bradysia coprophila]
MAKTARRSVASVPLSPLSSEYIQPSGAQSPIDPLRPSESIYTANTSQKFNTTNNFTRPYSSNEFQNGTHSGNSTIFDSAGAERERIRMEFYATYDVMTGVRIAATLGGFFGLMVFLVVYKSRGESQETMKALKDPKIAAVAAAVMQEEDDRKLQEAMEATGMSIYPDEYDHIGFRRERLMSIGNVSAPSVLNRGYRFSSLSGGYSSLLAPQRRFSYSGGGRRSNSVSSRVLSAYPMGGSFGIDDYFLETDGDEADDEFDQLTTSVDVEKSHCLFVPTKGHESRRSSSITCCSSESSYLERRYSSVTLGLTPLPQISSRNPSRRQSSTDAWDYSYPGIQIITPTPKSSPCPSEKGANEKRKVDRHKSLTKQDSFDRISEYPDEKSDTATSTNNKQLDTSRVNTLIRRAPLASLSSFKVSSLDYQDSDLRSLGSDSVFAESYADTDDELEQFSTDSDEVSDIHSPPNTRAARKLSMATPTKMSTRVDVESVPLNCVVKDVSELRRKNVSRSNSVHLVNTFETKAIIERQQHKQQQPHASDDTSIMKATTRPASYSGCTTSSLNNSNKNSNQNKINKNKSSECVDINVVTVDNRSIVSPSVILELPVISTQEIEENPPIDPSVPGPSRKWSKETLF